MKKIITLLIFLSTFLPFKVCLGEIALISNAIDVGYIYVYSYDAHDISYSYSKKFDDTIQNSPRNKSFIGEAPPAVNSTIKINKNTKIFQLEELSKIKDSMFAEIKRDKKIIIQAATKKMIILYEGSFFNCVSLPNFNLQMLSEFVKINF